VKRFLLFLLLALPLAARPPGKNATFTIVAETISSEGTCSATAIGPHAILTASHCEMPTDFVRVGDREAHVDKIIRDKQDHSIYLLGGITFTEFVEVKQNEYEIGQEFHVWGAPSSFDHIYRHGYVAGVIPTSHSGRPAMLVLDFNGFLGDSGAGMLNNEGQLIGIVTGIDEKKAPTLDSVFKMMGAYEMAFEPGDLHKARNYGVTPK